MASKKLCKRDSRMPKVQEDMTIGASKAEEREPTPAKSSGHAVSEDNQTIKGKEML